MGPRSSAPRSQWDSNAARRLARATEPAELGLLRRLRLDPFAQHLLLRAHVLDEALYALGEIGHGGGGGLA